MENDLIIVGVIVLSLLSVMTYILIDIQKVKKWNIQVSGGTIPIEQVKKDMLHLVLWTFYME